jgi:hypothetical protein
MRFNEETLEAKLRNQLTPIYGLADVILMIEEKPELLKIAIEMAKQSIENKNNINLILSGIEAKTMDKPDLLRIAFYKGCDSRLENKDKSNEELFDNWVKNEQK